MFRGRVPRAQSDSSSHFSASCAACFGRGHTRTFNGKEIKVEVLDAGFRYDGKTWRSLSSIAKAISGTSWNGFLFFNLQKRPAKPAKTEKAAPATAEAK